MGITIKGIAAIGGLFVSVGVLVGTALAFDTSDGRRIGASIVGVVFGSLGIVVSLTATIRDCATPDAHTGC